MMSAQLNGRLARLLTTETKRIKVFCCKWFKGLLNSELDLRKSLKRDAHQSEAFSRFWSFIRSPPVVNKMES